MSETNRIHYIPETVFGTTPAHPIGEIEPWDDEIPHLKGDLEFNGIVTGPPKGIAQFLHEWANGLEAMESSEVTIQIKGPAELMPSVR